MKIKNWKIIFRNWRRKKNVPDHIKDAKKIAKEIFHAYTPQEQLELLAELMNSIISYQEMEVKRLRFEVAIIDHKIDKINKFKATKIKNER